MADKKPPGKVKKVNPDKIKEGDHLWFWNEKHKVKHVKKGKDAYGDKYWSFETTTTDSFRDAKLRFSDKKGSDLPLKFESFDPTADRDLFETYLDIASETPENNIFSGKKQLNEDTKANVDKLAKDCIAIMKKDLYPEDLAHILLKTLVDFMRKEGQNKAAKDLNYGSDKY